MAIIIAVTKVDKKANKLAITIAHNKPSHTQHNKISLCISRIQRSQCWWQIDWNWLVMKNRQYTAKSSTHLLFNKEVSTSCVISHLDLQFVGMTSGMGKRTQHTQKIPLDLYILEQTQLCSKKIKSKCSRRNSRLGRLTSANRSSLSWDAWV